jgi:hypothetical protein
MGFVGALLLTFIILKLIGVITWSWWLVLVPLYPSVVIWVLIILNRYKQETRQLDSEWKTFDERRHLP